MIGYSQSPDRQQEFSVLPKTLVDRAPQFGPLRACMVLRGYWRLATGARPKQYTHI